MFSYFCIDNSQTLTMKKRIASLFISAIAIAISVILIIKDSPTADSIFFEANVEALSDGESFGPLVNCYLSVSDSYDPELYLEVRKCIDCTIVKTNHVSNSSTCNI